jgi:DnaK suppressor protein
MHEFQARLEQELHQALERLRQLGGAMVLDDFPHGAGDNAAVTDAADESQVNEHREITWATRSLLVERANKLAEALERLRRGVYGLCEECRRPIASARLRVMPEVTTCVRCQDRIEKEVRRSGMVGALFAAGEDEE